MALERCVVVSLLALFTHVACSASTNMPGDAASDAPGDAASMPTHEPQGMITVGPGVNPMSTLPPLQPTTDAWGQNYYAGQLEALGRSTLGVVNEPSAPFTPTTFYRVLFPQGFGGGNAPARWSLASNFPDLGGVIRRMYLSFWIRYSETYETGSKLVFFSQRDGNNHYIILAHGADTSFEAVIQNQNINFDRVVAPAPDLQQWNFVEVYLETGTAGQSDGVGRLWVNGALLLEKTDFRFFAAGADPQWSNLWMDPTYAGPADVDQHFDLGHVYVSVGL